MARLQFFWVALCLGACLMAGGTPAQTLPTSPPQALDYGLREEVHRIASDALELETTLFLPPSPGPHPLVVVNHGRSPGPARLQQRYRPLHVAYEFVRRGYAVVVPMREGFAASDGDETDDNCDLSANAQRQGRAVRAAVRWAQQQPWADASRVVVMGPSQGGLATLAYGAEALPGTRLLVNISGGLRMPACEGWEDRLVHTLAQLVPAAQPVASLWVYSDNDSHFGPAVWRTAFDRYALAGGHGLLKPVGSFGEDGHLLFSSRVGVPQWLPPVLDQLAGQGLPTAVQTQWDALLATPDTRHMPLHQQATEADVQRLTPLGPLAREAYRQWLSAGPPKAFALSGDGRHWSAVWGESQPMGKALQLCARQARAPCRLVAVDGFLASGGD